MHNQSTPLGIIAGQGDLPVRLAETVAAQGRGVVLAQMAGHPADNPGAHPVIDFRVERLGALFRALKSHGVRDLVMAGAVHRPRIDARCFDLKTLMQAPRLFAALRGGDDAALRAVVAIFEGQGFAVHGAHEFLSDLVVSAGTLGTLAPSTAQQTDARRGRAILNALGPQDVAQACAVARGLCLGIESIYGTDAMLSFIAENRKNRQPHHGGVFVKIAKPGQDLRVDMPVIGPATIDGVAEAGLDGLCLEAGRVMILDVAEVVRLAEARGICLWAC